MRSLNSLLLAGVAVLALGPAAYAADLIVDIPEEPGVVMAENVNWDGPYIGAHIGYGWGTADHRPLVPIGPGGLGNDLTLSGWFVGGQVGANFHLVDGIVAGIEGDLSWANITGTNAALFGSPVHTINWMGSVRGNLGFDAGGFMPYLTLGVGVADATRTSTSGPGLTASATHIGWTAGAGVKIAATENVSFDFQYRYSDLGTQLYTWSPAGFGTNPNVNLTVHTFRAGVNFEF